MTNQGGNPLPPQNTPPNGGPGGPTLSPGSNSSQNVSFGGGIAGPLRLFIEPLGEQIGWLLPLAILGLLALAWQRRPRPRSDRHVQSLLLWGMWLLTMGIFFSIAGFIHEYYLTVMAPAIAALCGIGLVVMWRDYHRGNWRGWLLPIALLLTAAEQVVILTNYPTWGQWMIPLLTIPCVLAAGALIGARFTSRWIDKGKVVRFLLPILAAGLIALVLTPTVWAAIPILQASEADLPQAGPAQTGPAQDGNQIVIDASGVNGSPTRSGQQGSVDPALLRYLEEHQGQTPVLLVTDSNVDNLILATNKPVIPLEGFSSYPLTTSELASLVARGTVRFFLLGNGGGPGGTLNPITSWVSQHCATVPPSQWQSFSSGSQADGNTGPGGESQLYDCAIRH